jgi:hypothetical protein
MLRFGWANSKKIGMDMADIERVIIVRMGETPLPNEMVESKLRMINELLLGFESLERYCQSHELFIIAKRKIHRGKKMFLHYQKASCLKQLYFLINKN